MLGPKQLEEIEKLKGDVNRQAAYTQKVLNQSVYKHMMNANSTAPSLVLDEEIELLELQPVAITSGYGT